MASSLLPKLLLLTTLVTISVISRANEELMIQECHNSDNPTLCLRCLSSDPTSPKADHVGVARIILRCVKSHLLTLTNNTSTLASKHHRNPKAAAALKQCRLGYAMAKRGVREADAHLIAGDYDKAAYAVNKCLKTAIISLRPSFNPAEQEMMMVVLNDIPRVSTESDNYQSQELCDVRYSNGV